MNYIEQETRTITVLLSPLKNYPWSLPEETKREWKMVVEYPLLWTGFRTTNEGLVEPITRWTDDRTDEFTIDDTPWSFDMFNYAPREGCQRSNGSPGFYRIKFQPEYDVDILGAHYTIVRHFPYAAIQKICESHRSQHPEDIIEFVLPHEWYEKTNNIRCISEPDLLTLAKSVHELTIGLQARGSNVWYSDKAGQLAEFVGEMAPLYAAWQEQPTSVALALPIIQVCALDNMATSEKLEWGKTHLIISFLKERNPFRRVEFRGTREKRYSHKDLVESSKQMYLDFSFKEIRMRRNYPERSCTDEIRDAMDRGECLVAMYNGVCGSFISANSDSVVRRSVFPLMKSILALCRMTEEKDNVYGSLDSCTKLWNKIDVGPAPLIRKCGEEYIHQPTICLRYQLTKKKSKKRKN